MFARIRKYFVSGLVVFLPIALTIYLFFLALNFVDGLLGQFLEPYFSDNFGFYFRGLGVIIGVYIIILIGFFVTNFIGKQIYGFFERFFTQLPFIKQVYPAIKEMAIFLFSRDRMSSFKKVVLIEYPRNGIYVIGFLTSDTSAKICAQSHKEMYNIFIPSAPGPLTGFVVMLPQKDVIFLDISIEEAFKFILSGGVVNPI